MEMSNVLIIIDIRPGITKKVIFKKSDFSKSDFSPLDGVVIPIHSLSVDSSVKKVTE